MVASTLTLVGLCLLALAPADESTAVLTGEKITLEEGNILPSFESLDDGGKPWKSSDHVGKKVVVLYFYPGDFTGGCIKQAQAFNEALVKLEKLDIELVGISGDEGATHKLFKDAYGLKHTLLSDPEGALAKQLGVPVEKGGKVRTRDPDGKTLLDEKGKSIIIQRKVTLPRWTFIIGRDGAVISRRTTVDPAKDAGEVASIVDALEN
jgi:thioredoxin-dependent peroxiredoxin